MEAAGLINQTLQTNLLVGCQSAQSNPAVQNFCALGSLGRFRNHASGEHRFRIVWCLAAVMRFGVVSIGLPFPFPLQLQFVHVFVRNLPNTFSAATPTDAHLEAPNFQLLNEGSR